MAVLDDMDLKLDRLLELNSEELNVDNRSLYVGAFTDQLVPLTNNASMQFFARWEIVRHPDGIYLHLTLKDPFGQPIIMRKWRCLGRDWISQVPTPGQS